MFQGRYGHARAISFEQITLENAKNPIIIKQTYVDKNGAVKVSDVTFRGFEGTSASAQAITLDCSELGCTNIVMDQIALSSAVPGKSLHSYCRNAQGRSILTSPYVPCLEQSK